MFSWSEEKRKESRYGYSVSTEDLGRFMPLDSKVRRADASTLLGYAHISPTRAANVYKLNARGLDDSMQCAAIATSFTSLNKMLIIQDASEHHCFHGDRLSQVDIIGEGKRGLGDSSITQEVIDLACWFDLIPRRTSAIYTVNISSSKDKEALCRKLSCVAHKTLYSESSIYDEATCPRPAVLPMREIVVKKAATDSLFQRFGFDPYVRYLMFRDDERTRGISDDRLVAVLQAYGECLVNSLHGIISDMEYGLGMRGAGLHTGNKDDSRIVAVNEFTCGLRSLPERYLHATFPPFYTAPKEFFAEILECNADRSVLRTVKCCRLLENAEELAGIIKDLNTASRLWKNVIAPEKSDKEFSGASLKWRMAIDASKEIGMDAFMDAALNHDIPVRDLFVSANRADTEEDE